MRVRSLRLLILPPLLTGLPACDPSPHSSPELQATPSPAIVQPKTQSQNPKNDLYGDPLPPHAITRLGTARFSRSPSPCITFSADGKTLVSGSDDNSLHVWDVSAGKEIRTLEGHKEYISSIALAKDGRTLASTSEDKTVQLWEMATGKGINIQLNYGLSRGDNACCVAFAPDKNLLAIGCASGKITLWEPKMGGGEAYPELRGHDMNVWSIAFSPDGKKLASGCLKGTIRLWSVDTWKELLKIDGHRSVLAIAFSPDGTYLASAGFDKISEHSIRLWDITTGKEISKFEPCKSTFTSMIYSPNGKVLATTSAKDNVIRLWDVDSGKEIQGLESQEKEGVHAIAFSRDGKRLASTHYNTTILIWDVAALLKDRK